jgi:rhamnose transport system substrate-binding protein
VNAQLPAVKYVPQQKMILLGDPLPITKDNVDKYNY